VSLNLCCDSDLEQPLSPRLHQHKQKEIFIVLGENRRKKARIPRMQAEIHR
jgi:hypothetical protein